MAGYDGQTYIGKFSLYGVEIRVTDPTDLDADEDLVGIRPSDGEVCEGEGILFDGGEMFKLHGFHGVTS